LSELIYTAWVEAGSPAFGSLTAIDTLNQNTFSVYPNPTKGIIKIQSNTMLKTEVCDVSGKSVGFFFGNQLDLTHLANGLYILKMYAKDGIVLKEKVLLAK
jgi:hypothetical protein